MFKNYISVNTNDGLWAIILEHPGSKYSSPQCTQIAQTFHTTIFTACFIVNDKNVDKWRILDCYQHVVSQQASLLLPALSHAAAVVRIGWRKILCGRDLWGAGRRPGQDIHPENISYTGNSILCKTRSKRLADIVHASQPKATKWVREEVGHRDVPCI